MKHQLFQATFYDMVQLFHFRDAEARLACYADFLLDTAYSAAAAPTISDSRPFAFRDSALFRRW